MKSSYDCEINLLDGRTIDCRVEYSWTPYHAATHDEPADGGTVEIDAIKIEVPKQAENPDSEPLWLWLPLPAALWPALFDLEKLEESILNEHSEVNE